MFVRLEGVDSPVYVDAELVVVVEEAESGRWSKLYLDRNLEPYVHVKTSAASVVATLEKARRDAQVLRLQAQKEAG